MRVIAGSRRSLPLKAVPGEDTRPTTDRIKETLFNILMPEIPGCRFLDLFAGSGGIGIEALSRGAGYACFADREQKAVRVIKENLAFTKLTDSSDVIMNDVIRLLSKQNRGKPFDVIFMDPPYGASLEQEAVTKLLSGTGWMHEDSLIVIEADIRTGFSWADDLPCEITRIKEYKTNKHVFMRLKKE